MRTRIIELVLRNLVTAKTLAEIKRQLNASYNIRTGKWDKTDRLSDTVNVG